MDRRQQSNKSSVSDGDKPLEENTAEKGKGRVDILSRVVREGNSKKVMFDGLKQVSTGAVASAFLFKKANVVRVSWSGRSGGRELLARLLEYRKYKVTHVT
jgi:hypothetical protein